MGTKLRIVLYVALGILLLQAVQWTEGEGFGAMYYLSCFAVMAWGMGLAMGDLFLFGPSNQEVDTAGLTDQECSDFYQEVKARNTSKRAGRKV